MVAQHQACLVPKSPGILPQRNDPTGMEQPTDRFRRRRSGGTVTIGAMIAELPFWLKLWNKGVDNAAGVVTSTLSAAIIALIATWTLAVEAKSGSQV